MCSSVIDKLLRFFRLVLQYPSAVALRCSDLRLSEIRDTFVALDMAEKEGVDILLLRLIAI
jgi:hypothetical protein